MSKPDKQDNKRYLIMTPINELLDDGSVIFAGVNERERLNSIMQFTRIRNIIQRYAQSLTIDDESALVECLKGYIAEKKV